ncbi:hypothetical protein ACWC9Q_24075 [Streptomyces sp. NPDC001142]
MKPRKNAAGKTPAKEWAKPKQVQASGGGPAFSTVVLNGASSIDGVSAQGLATRQPPCFQDPGGDVGVERLVGAGAGAVAERAAGGVSPFMTPWRAGVRPTTLLPGKPCRSRH